MKLNNVFVSFLVYLILQLAPLCQATQAHEILKRPADSTSLSKPSLMIRISDGFLTVNIIESSLRKVLEAIAQKSGIRIFLDGPTAENVTVKFYALPLDEGLRRLLHGRNVAFLYSGASGSNTTSPTRLEEVYIFTGGGTGVSSDKSGLPEADMVAERAVSDASEPQDTVLGAQEITSLGVSRDKGAIEALARGLSEENSGRLRKSATEALGKTWSPDAIDPLTRVLLEDPDPSVREAAATALGQTWSESAVESLGPALLGDQDATVRAAAARALGETWSEAAHDFLTRGLLGDPNRYVRESAAQALGEIGDAGAVQALIQALQDQDMSVRESAAQALSAIGSPQAAEALLQTSLNDKDPWVRESASQSAWKIFQNTP